MDVKVSIFGFGNVGRATARVLLEKAGFIRRRYGREFKVVSITDRSGTLWMPEGIDLREALAVKESLGRISAWTNDY